MEKRGNSNEKHQRFREKSRISLPHSISAAKNTELKTAHVYFKCNVHSKDENSVFISSSSRLIENTKKGKCLI